jgi:hypothetical protein
MITRRPRVGRPRPPENKEVAETRFPNAPQCSPTLDPQSSIHHEARDHRYTACKPKSVAREIANMPVHHVCIRVPPAKFDETVSFYLKALAPLDYAEIMRFEGVVGIGAGGIPDFWISTREGANEKGETHVAFTSKGTQCTRTPRQDARLLTPETPQQSALSSIASTKKP